MAIGQRRLLGTRATGRLAEALFAARQSRSTIEHLPADLRPEDIEAGYSEQRLLVDRLLEEGGGHSIGYKIGCTSIAAQQAIGAEGPMHGQLLGHATHPSPVKLQAADFGWLRIIEPEIAFQLGADCEPRTDHTRESVEALVESVLPCIEVATTVLKDIAGVGPASLCADNAGHGCWVKGATFKGDWRKELPQLSELPVHLTVNGRDAASGRGELVLGHPLHALAWLANQLGRKGQGLYAGQFISTGICVDSLVRVEAGDHIIADFHTLGQVEITML